MVIDKNKLLIGIGIAGILAVSGIILAGYGKSPFAVESALNPENFSEKKTANLRKFSDFPASGGQGGCKNIIKSETARIEAYGVSQCPFGLQMQRVLANVVESAPELADRIEVRYISSMASGRLFSMHGEEEARENLRQICAREEHAGKYWDYISCYIKKGDSAGCLSAAGISAGSVEECARDPLRGIKYAKEDIDLTSKHGIEGSPTILVNGNEISEFDFSGRNPESIKNIICCGFNNPPDACSATLINKEPATGFSETYLKSK